MDREWIAIDSELFEGSEISGSTKDRLRRSAKVLSANFSLVPATVLSPEERIELERDKVVSPVFRHGSALLVALPEIRVEESLPAEQELLKKWFDRHDQDLSVLTERNDRFLVAPLSGKAEDALSAAQELNPLHPTPTGDSWAGGAKKIPVSCQ